MNFIEFVRLFRIGEYVIFDFVAAFLGIYLFSSLLSKIIFKIKIYIPKRNWLYLVLPLGIFTHIVVGNITPLTRDFLDLQGHFILKIFIFVLLIFGARGVNIGNKKV